MSTPQQLVEEIERSLALPEGSDERFAGYGVMGLPFASGHILCLRRFPASSIGPAYTSLWHRDPDDRWTMYQNVPPQQACPRYFGSAIAEAHELDVAVEWTGPTGFSVTTVGGNITWHVSLAATAATRLMNAMSSLMPDALWRQAGVLRLMAIIASGLLRAGKLGMIGQAPNGQQFIANPRLIWSIPTSAATVQGQDLGPVGPAPVQARLGDFWIPQRGIFAIGRAFFEPFDESRHGSVTSQTEAT